MSKGGRLENKVCVITGAGSVIEVSTLDEATLTC